MKHSVISLERTRLKRPSRLQAVAVYDSLPPEASAITDYTTGLVKLSTIFVVGAQTAVRFYHVDNNKLMLMMWSLMSSDVG